MLVREARDGMDPSFGFVQHGPFELLVYLPWWRAGVVHGMTMRRHAFRGDSAARDVGALCESFRVEDLVVPRQCHGNGVLDLRPESVRRALVESSLGRLCRFEEGDALLIPCDQGTGGPRLAFGVMSADCVPVLLRAGTGWAAVHAGWRGLANGVIERAVKGLGGVVEGIVFASAGGAAYEVGREVVEAIGATAAFEPVRGRDDRALLDTAATAVNQLRRVAREAHLASAGICTIQEPRFHSFRRDGEAAGRGITFVVPP